jgi:3-oxoacyl-[acyl-carrier-protein] synthase II
LTASLLTFVHGTVPGTRNYREPDPECPVYVPRESWPVRGQHFLKISLTELGQCAAVVCRRWQP